MMKYWLALLRIGGFHNVWKTELLTHFQSCQALFEASHQALAACGLSEAIIQAIKNPPWAEIENDLAWLEKSKNHHIITYNDPCYPRLLKEIARPPLLLYIHGNKTLLEHYQVAMVGSRHPSPSGNHLAHQFAAELAAKGWVITSGLALGIDSASHQGALSVKGQTIAVLGTSIDRIYPARHQKLAEAILENNGTLVSEFPITTPARPENFPQRNRIISGLSVGTLVVEAASQSGSLITAKYALEQNREVFAIPGSVLNPVAQGCHELIKQGAKLVDCVDDIITELQTLVLPPTQATPSIQTDLQTDLKLDLKQQKLLDCIGYEPTPVDLMIDRSAFTASEVATILMELELLGFIQQVLGGYARVR